VKKSPVPLTVIIITHRRDGRFRAALASAQPANEVLVADYSKKPPITDFAAVRNAWLKKAKHDWVFFLDSDEVIETKSWPHIETLIRSTQLAGVWVRRTDVFYGRKLRFGETGHVWLLRLMRKNQTRFTRPVHEVAVVNGPTKKSHISLLHTSHPSLTEFFQDVVSYSRLEARFQHDAKLPVWLLAAKTLIYPLGKFVINFFVKLGLLGGWRGAAYAVMMSLHSLFVRIYSYENRA
jgi:glycosyltransferase involved in cell wall biosynthesis